MFMRVAKKTKLSNDMKTFLECLDEAAAITEAHHISAFIKLNLDEIHLIMLQAAADIYASQSNSHKHSVMQAEGSDVSEGAAVGQRSAGTNAEARECETCKHLESTNPYPCGKCDEDYSMWEAPSGGHL